MSLIAQALLKDARIEEAKKLILHALKEQQEKIKKPKPADPLLKDEYEKILEAFKEMRGQKLYFPYIGSGIGNGSLVELLDGSIKYDFISGIGPHYFGHSNLEVVSELLTAALSDTVMQGNLQQNIEPLEFGELLTKATDLPHCFLTSSGAMANENALKIAFQKNFPRNRLLSFEKCFAGRTLALSQLTDKPAFREGLPLNYDVDYIPFYDAKEPHDSIKKSVAALKKHLTRYPKQHAAMCFEFVQGEGGFNVGTQEFFITLMKILKEHDIAIFADEVQTFGRTEELFAFQYFGLAEYVDIVSFGKLSQVCGTLFTREFNPKPGLLSQTFISSTAALKAGSYMIRFMLNKGFFGSKGKIAEIHRYFKQKLEDLSHKYPNLIQGPFGIGTMIAFTPFHGDAVKTAEFIQKLFQNGVISFVAGANPTRVRFLIPADFITLQDIDEALKIVEETLLEFEVS
ncbi:MAG TPA: aminotransferase class III-fold pyridoxal phosphate-dependent enzyme [Parachlamydiaceae bacterium]|nr:aminotransferase class III-fold pyridoxal phosphate-dependent enzyme [Parachlamydiaceae bacterium]